MLRKATVRPEFVSLGCVFMKIYININNGTDKGMKNSKIDVHEILLCCFQVRARCVLDRQISRFQFRFEADEIRFGRVRWSVGAC